MPIIASVIHHHDLVRDIMKTQLNLEMLHRLEGDCSPRRPEPE